MAAPTETYIDPAVGASAGNDHGGAAFVDGSFANATLTLTKVGAFPAATCQAGDKLYLDDNGSGEVTPGLYTITTRTDDNNVVLASDIRSGANDPTDVRCDQHTGAVGLPWATVQHALDFTTRDAVNGDRFNVKAGTDDVLAAALDFTTYGAPNPWVLQGYTTAAGDGGIGGISGGGAFGIFASSALDTIFIQDMHLHNCGAADVIDLDNNIKLINVEIDNTTGGGIDIDNNGLVLYCHVHNVGGNAFEYSNSSVVLYSVFENGANDMTRAIYLGYDSYAIGNIISIDGASDGIYASGNDVVMGNTVYSAGGTGEGITTGTTRNTILNNIVEGFSGVGGIGYDINGNLLCYGHNSAYNNTTNFDLAGGILVARNLGNNTVLTASPFANPGGGDFRVNTSVKDGGWPTAFPGISTDQFLDEGAAQRQCTDGPTLRGRNILLRM